jgi:hypothetical protein
MKNSRFYKYLTDLELATEARKLAVRKDLAPMAYRIEAQAKIEKIIRTLRGRGQNLNTNYQLIPNA